MNRRLEAWPSAGFVYQPQLDGLRAVAVLMVFLHHAYAIHLLWAGVDLFFILSGYLITNVLLRDRTLAPPSVVLAQFYLRRARRILPAYIVSLALISVLVPWDWKHLWPYYCFFVQNIPYAFHYIDFGPLIPLWSLAVEQQFYLVWPFAILFLSRRAIVLWLGAILVGVPVLRYLCTPLFETPEVIYSLAPFRVDAMAAGALIAMFIPQWKVLRAQRWSLLLISSGILTYAVLSAFPAYRRAANAPAFNSTAYSLNIIILGSILVWTLVASRNTAISRALASAPLRGLGRISYSFYLLHLLVLVTISSVVPSSLVPCVGFVLTVFLAMLSWYTIERPILRASLGRVSRNSANGS